MTTERQLGRAQGMVAAEVIADGCVILNAEELSGPVAAQVMREIIVGAIAGNRRAMSNAYAKDRSGDEISPEREREK